MIEIQHAKGSTVFLASADFVLARGYILLVSTFEVEGTIVRLLDGGLDL